MGYTTTEFITNVKKRAAVPTSQSTYSVQNMLAFADAELRSFVVPTIMRSQEFYYAFDVDTAINASGSYDISSRAVGGKVSNVCLVNGNDRRDLNWITEDQLVRYDQSNYGRPGVYIKRNQIKLVPIDGAGYSTLRATIFIRPGQLVATAECAQITAINTGTNTLTFALGTIPATFTVSIKLDFIQQNPHFDHLSIDMTPSSVTSTTIVFSSLDSRLQVGDWVCLAHQSCIVQCPVEMHGLLEQATANTILRAQGDLEKAAAGDKKLADIYETSKNTYSPRIESEGKKVINRSKILRRF